MRNRQRGKQAAENNLRKMYGAKRTVRIHRTVAKWFDDGFGKQVNANESVESRK